MLLSTMLAANEQAWSKAHAATYALILSDLGEEAGSAAVVQSIKTLKWRPAPSELREMAATLVSPLPPPGILWTEFWHKVTHMPYATPHWTHPILGDIAKHLGGWQSLREHYWPDSHPQHINTLRVQFESAYRDCSAAWRDGVIAQLALPLAERDQRYFPARRTFEPPPKSLPSGHKAEIAIAPEEAKALIAGIRERVGRGLKRLEV